MLTSTLPAARASARDKGWDFTKYPAIGGRKIELWRCPAHAAEVREKIKNHRRNRLLVYSDEPVAVDTTLDEAEERVTSRQNSFERAFGRILTGSEIGACNRLRAAIQTVEIAGNASMSYDGVGVDSFSFGSKTLAESVIEAQNYIRRCQTAVIGTVQMIHHDAWRVLIGAIANDLNVRQTGDMICKMRKDKRGRDARIALAGDVVQKSAHAIENIRY